MRRGALVLICLAAVFAAAIGGSAAVAKVGHPPRTDYRAGTECGTLQKIFAVVVTKGDLPCSKALEVAKVDLGRRHCGSGGEPACVDDGYHCRLASFETQRKTGIGIYCYVLKHPLTAAKDHSPYRLSAFRLAFAIYVRE